MKNHGDLCKPFKTSDPLTVLKYAHQHKLINKQGFKWCKRHHRDPCRFVKAVNIPSQNEKVIQETKIWS